MNSKGPNQQRARTIAQLQETHFDLIIIGGGITGAGIALDAASRGLQVALVEKNDYASGTSSRSTKLIHGGLRYLKQFEIALVREVGRERAIVHELAPHLVVPEKMLLPLIEGGTFGKFLTSIGLMVYDVLAGVESADQRVMLSKEKTLELEPLLPEDRLRGGGIYAEYRTDDARLTIEVIKTAQQKGAICLNYGEARRFLYDGDRVVGIEVHDNLNDQTFEIRGQYTVSAAGPWVDEIRGRDAKVSGKRLHLTKGVHLVVPHDRLPLRQSVYFDVPDGRMVFAIPRLNVTYIGTTDTDYHGDPNHVITNQEDAEYLLDAVNRYFPDVNLTLDDVASSWAGLRPLIHEEGKSASELSRKDEIFESKRGLISIAGGKLTGYRKMAERIVDLIAKQFRRDYDRKLADTRTDKIDLVGGTSFPDYAAVEAYRAEVRTAATNHGLSDAHAHYLVANYGDQSMDILERTARATAPEGRVPEIAAERRLILGELAFCLENEQVYTALDFLTRRTGRLYFDIDSVKRHEKAVREHMARVLEWNDARQEEERAAVAQAVLEAENFPPLAETIAPG